MAIQQNRTVRDYPVTVEGDTTIVHNDDWDGVKFKLPWLATDEQVAAICAIVDCAEIRAHQNGETAGRAALADTLRKLLGAAAEPASA